jgi:hypothetical protein
MTKILTAIALVMVSTLSTSVAMADDLSDFMGGFKGRKLEKAIVHASAFPLGSGKNPVRVDMPEGQRAYLSKLRCENGEAPKFERGGSVGEAPFGSIVDVYEVDCGASAPGKVAIYLDMYHSGHTETRAVPGFSIIQ